MTQILSSIVPIIIAILVFSILVVVHEFGHYIVAKKSGIFVEEFAVGMGPTLISKKIGETVYSIRAFPLGGFCKMLGEDESIDDDRAFNSKSVYKRMAVIFAGPFMNFVLALIICIGIVGRSGFALPVVAGLVEEANAITSGVEIGDEIVKLNNKHVSVYEDISMFMLENQGETVDVTVKRNGEKLTIPVEPYKTDDGRWILGFNPTIKTGIFDKDYDGFDKANIIETLKTGFDTMVFYVRSTVDGFVKLITLNVSMDDVAGPIGIIEVVGESYEEGMKHSIGTAIANISYIGALLSANLGAINLFPIPALDGGRLVFLIIEALRGKPLNPEKEGMIHFIGFALLMAFMVFIAYNDISKIFGG
ncbi:MAG: RIP metalloprotease RseP [Tyzzerella sp.]|uniref:Zinc metalloprotease n=1 Tax=Candidatus Fimicola merdigallinarum TaxID=2840819 RepID=A0A9D9DVM2_9FIRM|nr:RIP metalloprotease RseP [Candidatus Fimicola merdigallinarum]